MHHMCNKNLARTSRSLWCFVGISEIKSPLSTLAAADTNHIHLNTIADVFSYTDLSIHTSFCTCWYRCLDRVWISTIFSFLQIIYLYCIFNHRWHVDLAFQSFTQVTSSSSPSCAALRPGHRSKRWARCHAPPRSHAAMPGHVALI